MYALIIDYIKSPQEVDNHMPAHLDWVKKHIAKKNLLLAGPKKCRLGGVIIAKSMELNTLKEIIAEDPFYEKNLVDYRIIDIDCLFTIKELDFLKSA